MSSNRQPQGNYESTLRPLSEAVRGPRSKRSIITAERRRDDYGQTEEPAPPNYLQATERYAPS